MNTRLLAALLFVALAVPAAQAGILDIRVGAGINSENDDAFEDEVDAIDADEDIESEDFDNFNADVFFNIPATPLGVGVRHEWLSRDADNLDIDVNNLALLVDLRLIDSVFYLGPIVSVGYPWGEVNFENSLEDEIEGDRVSYSGGLEAGVYLGSFLVGAEAGYSSMKLKQKDTADGTTAKIDLSGFYGKAMVGLSFF